MPAILRAGNHMPVPSARNGTRSFDLSAVPRLQARRRPPKRRKIENIELPKIEAALPCPWHVSRNVEYLMRRPVITLKEVAGAGLFPRFADSDKVLAAVCKAFGFEANQIISLRRRSDIARARFALFMLMADLTTMSIAAIGRYTQRDHSTVLHGIKRARALLGQEVEFERRCDYAKRELVK